MPCVLRFPFGEGVYAGRGGLTPEIIIVSRLSVGTFVDCYRLCQDCVGTFVAEFRVCSVEVIDGVHRMQLNFSEISFTDPVELRSGLGRRGPRHLFLFGGKVEMRTWLLADGPKAQMDKIRPESQDWTPDRLNLVPLQ